MKNKIWFLVLSFLSLIIKSNAQLAPSLSLSLSLEQENLGLLDPWFFKLEVRNISKSEVDFLPTLIIGGLASTSTEIRLEIKNKRLSNWVDSKIILNWCNHEGYNYFKLRPDEVQIYEFQGPSPNELLDIGLNEARASFSFNCSTDGKSRINSIPISIQIQEYSGQDLEAYKYLLKSCNPHFVFYPVVNTVFDTANIAKAEFLVENFPESFFAEYGRASLNRLYLSKANYSDFYLHDREKTLFYLRKSKKYGELSLMSKNPKILDKVNNQMSQLLEVAARAYDYEEPEDIQKEFFFTKN